MWTNSKYTFTLTLKGCAPFINLMISILPFPLDVDEDQFVQTVSIKISFKGHLHGSVC